jgi:hypothetical protein
LRPRARDRQNKLTFLDENRLRFVKQAIQSTMTKDQIIKEFTKIPSVGPAVASDLYRLGYRSFGDMVGADPNDMYARLCKLQKMHVDRCMLYTFYCVVYYVSHTTHDPKLLKWWNWKEQANKV